MRIKYHVVLLGLLILSVWGVTTIIDSDNSSYNTELPTSSTSFDQRQTWVDEGCHPALSTNGTFYQVCD